MINDNVIKYWQSTVNVINAEYTQDYNAVICY